MGSTAFKYHHKMGAEHLKCEPVGGILDPNSSRHKAQQTYTASKSCSHMQWVLLIKFYCNLAMTFGKHIMESLVLHCDFILE